MKIVATRGPISRHYLHVRRIACPALVLLVLAGCDRSSTDRPIDPVDRTDPARSKREPESTVVTPDPPAERAAESLIGATKAECPDPLEGVWYAKGFFEPPGVWREIKLTISEDSGTLTGTILQRGWDGNASRSVPGVLSDGTFDGFIVTEPAIGRTDGKRLDFRATVIEKQEGSAEYIARGYALDHFTGVIEDRTKIRMFNNDGSYAFDRPYDFRRISCD